MIFTVLIVVFSFLAAALLYLQLKIWYTFRSVNSFWKTMPGDTLLSVLPLGAFQRPFFGLDFSKKYGQLYHVQMVHVPIVVIASSELAAEYFNNYHNEFIRDHKVGMFNDLAKYIFINYLGFRTGDRWKRSLAILKPEFTTATVNEHLQCFVEQINSWCSKTLHDGAVLSQQGGDVANLFVQIMAHLLYGNDLTDGEFKELMMHRNLVRECVLSHVFNPFSKLPLIERLYFHVFGHKAETLRKNSSQFHMRKFRQYLDQGIDKRSDLFSRAGKRYLETGGSMSEEEVSQQLLILIEELMFFDVDVAAVGFMNALVRIAANRDVHDELAAEIRTKLHRAATAEDYLNVELPFYEAVIKECARIEPATSMDFPNKVGKSIVLGGYHIPEGSLVICDAFSINYDECVWPDPECFDPNRFLNKEPTYMSKQFLRYGLNPRRQCLGYRYSEALIKVLMCNIFMFYDVSIKGNLEDTMRRWKSDAMASGLPFFSPRHAYPDFRLTAVEMPSSN